MCSNFTELSSLASCSTNRDVENIVELPNSSSFKLAIEELKLPPIMVGREFNCVVKLFTYNNTFRDRIKLRSITSKHPDFRVSLDVEKGVLYINGCAQSLTDLVLLVEYGAIKKDLPSVNYDGQQVCQFVEKHIRICQDAIVVLNNEFKDVLKNYMLPLVESNEDDKNVVGYDSFTVGEICKISLDLFDEGLGFCKEQLQLMKDRISFLGCKSTSQRLLEIKIEDSGKLQIEGLPDVPGDLSLVLNYDLRSFNKTVSDSVEFKIANVVPEKSLQKWDVFVTNCKNFSSIRTVVGESMSHRFDFPKGFESSCMKVVEITVEDPSLSVTYSEDEQWIEVCGVPTKPEHVSLQMKCEVLTVMQGSVLEMVEFPVLNVTPNPKLLWKNIPTNPDEPYQTKDEEVCVINAGLRTVLAASKRGRSHAHDGKFRDDSFKVDFIEETGWFIVAVSDGAGSAKFSREGARIACNTFWEVMREKLSSQTVNDKIDNMPLAERENVLRNTLLTATYQALSRIDEEAKQAANWCKNVTRRDYHATFLGYVMKHFSEGWQIVSIGIGDGAIALLDRKDCVHLLTEPDGGEFVGQTRFITMNDVWNDTPITRTKALLVDDFSMIFSMSDGVSDPKFETDNNLKRQECWLALREELETSVALSCKSEDSAKSLSAWLDFWSKGNHDDRTLVLVY